MKFFQPQADIFVPDDIDISKACRRTTHLAIGAHQDDLEIFAYHGIAQCFANSNCWFTGVIVTNGSGSPRTGSYKDFSDEQMQNIRKQEQRKAAFIGEYSLQIQLNYPSHVVKNNKENNVVEDLTTILKETQPEIVYLHNPADKHDTHIAVLTRSLGAIKSLPLHLRPKKVYGGEVWRDLDWLIDSDKVALSTGLYENLAHALLGVFDSQISGGKRYDLATMGRRMAHATYFRSHEADKTNSLSWAMDLTPLIEEDSLSLEEYTLKQIDNFREDTKKRIAKFSL